MAPDPTESFRDIIEYVGFSEEDEALLVALAPFVEPELHWMVDRFYDAVWANAETRAVLAGPEQVERLKQTLRQWIHDLLNGPHDREYWIRRHRIGQVHVRVGLPNRFVFAAMNLIRSDLIGIAHRNLPSALAWQTCHALTRLTDVELSVMSGTYMDAREQEELRTLQDLIVRSMPVTVLCLDAEGRVTAATRPSHRLFGGSAHIGRYFEDFLPVDLVQGADLPTHVGRALATGQEISLGRLSVGEGADIRHLRINIVPLNHPLARVLLHVEELTDVVLAEQRLQQAEALARIGSLAANVAHEIRNPLAAISATLQVIGGTLGDEDRRKTILEKVQAQVHRLDRLVTDLLGYARPARPRLERVELRHAVREAVLHAGVETALSLPDEAVESLADAQHLAQILVNLLQNARDAAGPSGRVEVSVEADCHILVADDGPGVAPEVATRLFEPFVTTKTRGTGLGLAICQKLTEAMEGSLVLLSGQSPAVRDEERGPGACFRLSLRKSRPSAGASPSGNGARSG